MRRIRKFSYPRGDFDSRTCGDLKPYSHFVSDRRGSAHFTAKRHHPANRYRDCRTDRYSIHNCCPNTDSNTCTDTNPYSYTDQSPTYTHSNAHWSAYGH